MQIQEDRETAQSFSIGARTLALRKRMALTQSEFALKIGIPKSTYVAWERGEAEPPARLFSLLRDAFGMESALDVVGLDAGPLASFGAIDWSSFAQLCEKVQNVTLAAGYTFAIADVVEIAGLVKDRHLDAEQGLRDVQQLLRLAGRQRSG
jgi:transcriptional regulator with XRE-family HTH domain